MQTSQRILPISPDALDIPNQLQNAMGSPEGSVQTLPFGINRGKGFARPRDDLKSKQFSTMLAF